MRKFLFTLSIIIPCFGIAQSNKQDSAVIIFKNITKDTFSLVQAVVKGQDIIVRNLKPGEEYKETISTYCVAPDCTPVYKFKIEKTNGGYGNIEPDDYKALVGTMDITTGTYVYTIGWAKKPAEQWPDIKLKKQN